VFLDQRSTNEQTDMQLSRLAVTEVTWHYTCHVICSEDFSDSMDFYKFTKNSMTSVSSSLSTLLGMCLVLCVVCVVPGSKFQSTVSTATRRVGVW